MEQFEFHDVFFHDYEIAHIFRLPFWGKSRGGSERGGPDGQDRFYDEEDGDDNDDDIYIMMSVCLFVCNEKSSLPPGSLL